MSQCKFNSGVFKVLVLLAMLCIFAASLGYYSGDANAQTCEQECTDILVEGSEAFSEGSVSGAESYSEGSVSGAEAYSEGSASEAESYSEGGAGGNSESFSEGSSAYSSGGSAESDQTNTQYPSVGGNNSSFRYNREEAAKTAAALTTAVCQDGTSLQGVKFGLSKVNQSAFCMYTVTAQLSLGISASMVCEDGPAFKECWRRKEALLLQGFTQLQKAIDYADGEERGIVKRILRRIW